MTSSRINPTPIATPTAHASDGLARVSRGELELLSVIALVEPLNVTRLQSLASAIGQRQSPERAHDTKSLGKLLVDWQRRGLVEAAPGGFRCAPPLGWSILRATARARGLDPIVTAIADTLYPLRGQGYSWYDGPRQSLLARAALASSAPDLSATLERLATLTSERDVMAKLLAPALFDGFDPIWFESLPAPVIDRWLAATLSMAEASGRAPGPLFSYLLGRLPSLAPRSILSLAGVAILRGDLAGLRALAEGSQPDVRCSLEAALATVEGRYDEANAKIPMPSKGSPQGDGLIGILHSLALIQSGRAEALAFAQRLITAGSRKTSDFRQSYSVLRQILQCAMDPSAGRTLSYGAQDTDTLVALLELLCCTWFDSKSDLADSLLFRAEQMRQSFARQGLHWLAGETVAACQQLANAEGRPRSRGQRSFPKLEAPKPAGELADASSAKPLVGLLGSKAPWQLALEGLERLASPAQAPGSRPAAALERLIWRVNAEFLQLEPYLQKQTGSGWTRGRRLALKHLVPNARQALTLDEDDARVAAHTREERSSYGGFQDVQHHFELQAFSALVGHPRVYLGEADEPIPVVRGQVQLLAKSADGRLQISVFPADFGGTVQLVPEPARLVVYTIEAAAESVLKWVGAGLSFPESARPRVMEVLGQLSHLLPVQAFESGNARSVPADPQPWLRITPTSGGLSIALSVRPLGELGPQVGPADGAPTLLGRVEGESVQAERDFHEERELCSALLARCPELEAHQTSAHHFTLEGSEACLALISTLRDFEQEVHVEWARGSRPRLRGRATRKSLRGDVRSSAGFFLASGTLAVDAELSLELAQLLDLVVDSPGRFVRLEGGDYLELEAELRETLHALQAARSTAPQRAVSGTRAGVSLSASALGVLESLTDAESGFALDEAATAFKARFDAAFARRYPVPRRLEAELRPYQEEGFRWLARLSELSLAACLADDMGLGKTVQILALLLYRAKSGPALVVAPTSVCDNWRDEILRFAPSLRVRSYLGSDREAELARSLTNGEVVITSYGLLQQDIERLEPLDFGTVVLDEAQFIKNADSLRAQAACRLRAGFRVAATGTPVENHVGDLFGIFQYLLPDLLGSRAAFGKRFPLDAGGEPGVVARQSLRRLLQPFILRRTKAQVLAELPGLTEVRRSVSLSASETALYESVRRAALAKLDALADKREKRPAAPDPGDRFQILAEITRLRRLCCHPELVAPGATSECSKLASFLELVDELIAGHHRALVFSQFVDMLGLVRAALDERRVSYQYLDGSTPSAERRSAVQAFQAGEGELFLISLRAGGFGLNLTGADYVIHLDPWWNPAVEAQATDRAHRIGQTRPVTVYRLITANTIEERIIELHRSKRELADALLEDSDKSAKLGADELRALLAT